MGCRGDEWREHSTTLLVFIIHDSDVAFVAAKLGVVVSVERQVKALGVVTIILCCRWSVKDNAGYTSLVGISKV